MSRLKKLCEERVKSGHMNKRVNYDDLLGFKTSTQRRNDAQIAMVQADIKKLILFLYQVEKIN